MSTKKCTKCGIEKPLAEFSKRSASKDGHVTQCKSCVREYSKQYYKNYQIKPGTKERQKQYYLENKERLKERGKEYRAKNKEKLAEKRSLYYKKNKEKILKISSSRWVPTKLLSQGVNLLQSHQVYRWVLEREYFLNAWDWDPKEE